MTELMSIISLCPHWTISVFASPGQITLSFRLCTVLKKKTFLHEGILTGSFLLYL